MIDTTPLPPAKLEPPGSESISSDGYRLDALRSPAELPDLLVLVAMSGGGKRSAAFAYGALKGMREEMIPAPGGPRPLLNELAGISGVSGGSFTAAYYGLYRDKTFGQYEKDFLYSDTNSYIFGIYLLPWNWGWLVDPTVGTNDYMESVYRQNDIPWRDVCRPDAERPTRDRNRRHGYQLRHSCHFHAGVFRRHLLRPVEVSACPRGGRIERIPRSVSPVTLTNRAADCGGRRPGWERRITEAQRRDPLSRLGVQANNLDRYLDPTRVTYVHLADGGISDNLALRVAGSMMQNLAQSPRVLMAGYIISGASCLSASTARARRIPRSPSTRSLADCSPCSVWSAEDRWIAITFEIFEYGVGAGS